MARVSRISRPGGAGERVERALPRPEDLGQLQLDDFSVADDAQGQRLGEDHAWLRMEALRGAQRQGGPAEHAFEAVHEIVMADEAKIAGLAKRMRNLCAAEFEPWTGKERSRLMFQVPCPGFASRGWG